MWVRSFETIEDLRLALLAFKRTYNEAHVRRVLEASPFHGEGYRKVWAKLRVEGRRTSKERVRRLMREHDLQAGLPRL